MVDNPLVVLGEDFEFLHEIQREGEGRDTVVAMELGGVQRVPEKLKAAARLAVIHRAGEAGNIHATADEIRGGSEGALVRAGVLERAGVRRDRRKQIGRHFCRNAGAHMLEKFQKNLPGGGRGRIDVIHIAVVLVADVMVDIEDRRAGGDGFVHRAEAVFDRGIERDKNIEFLRRGGRQAHDLVVRQVVEFRGRALLVVGRHFLAAIAQPEGKGNGRSQRVGVGADMAGNSHRAGIAKRI